MVVAICSFAACVDSPERPAQTGWLEARWTGADTGQIATHSTAEWCRERQRLEIRAIDGDTGIALVVYPRDTVETDSYRVVQPERAESVPPAASIALRVFSSTTIQGYQGDSGTVVLESSSSGELSGTFEATVRSVVNGQLLTLIGEARDLVVVPQARGCKPEAPADSTDYDPEISDSEIDPELD
jgi:hypothetical protein